MCISPSKLGNGIWVGCRKCWQCRSDRVNAWVGRNIAETKTSVVSYAITLTYGRSWDGRADHLRSVLLTYSDVQKMFKRMRKAGMKFRYMMAGEYGTKLGRAHWHGVIHFYGDVLPDWEGEHLNWSQEKWDRVGGIHIDEWASYDGRDFVDYLGHVHIKKATYAHVQYALKYMMKGVGDDAAQATFVMSRNPPIGHAYFMERAAEYAQAGLAPQDLGYRFQVRKMDGEVEDRTFYLKGRLAEMYLQEYIDSWRRIHGERQRPDSEVVDTYEQWGRLGLEENLTQSWVEKLPGKGSMFKADGGTFDQVRGLDAEGRPVWKNKPKTWAEHCRALMPGEKRSRINGHLDWFHEWMDSNEFTEEERQRFTDDFWAEAERNAREVTGLSCAEYDEIWKRVPALGRDLVNNPARFEPCEGRSAFRLAGWLRVNAPSSPWLGRWRERRPAGRSDPGNAGPGTA